MSFPKIYTVNGPSSTSASSLPSWITIKTKPTRNAQGQRKRVKTQHQLGSLELIQDFAFPGSSMKVKTTEDGEHVMATGTYKPMIKVWELDQLAVKFERVTEAENVDFVVRPQQAGGRRVLMVRCYRPTGRNHSICNETDRYNFIPKVDYTTPSDYPRTAVHLGIIHRPPTH
jgi:hypothetical protein